MDSENKFKEYYDFRDALVDELLRDLIGPSSEFEEIDDKPLDRYKSGILYPGQGEEELAPEENIDPSDEDDDSSAPDPPIAAARIRYPSSMGITFAVDADATSQITVTVKTARYIPIDQGPPSAAHVDAAAEEEAVLKEIEGREGKGKKRFRERPKEKQQRWRRKPINPDAVFVDISSPDRGYRDDYIPLADGLELFYRVRRAKDGVVPVTLVLLNKHIAPKRGLSDADSFFQPEIVVTTPGVSGGAFVDRPTIVSVGEDEDMETYRLIYRHAHEFGIGHGCSVQWQLAPGSRDRADRICSTFAPMHELRLADSPELDLPALKMRSLRDGRREDAARDLGELCSGYETWIGKQETEAKSLKNSGQLNDEQFQTAEVHLNLCRDALKRMRRGIQLLLDPKDDKPWKAFTLANAAMLEQRTRTDWLSQGDEKPADGPSGDPSWRPFQLAFILLCLESMVNPQSADRKIADLLWFPTGGGKTEAYLGLIAFTVFLRRLRYKDGGGVTALMRYTLRLLTIQQFERAALLICCCEAIRRKDSTLGQEPISIGLWLGQSATPNDLSAASAALTKLRAGAKLPTGNPMQLRTCPWCGTELDPRNYWKADSPKRLVISCGNKECIFKEKPVSEWMPVFVVDEDVYKYRPTLIIATVDKFASLPWREQTANLFNLKTALGPEQPPPELIIQDEMHLISGPLGTLTGLYETAVDELCTRDGVGPKVIASTATIRRAKEQAVGVFNRELRQFPPPGLSIEDSYFAVESKREEKGTRLYLGLMAPGTSHTTLLVRAYATLLQKAAELPAPSDDVRDPYWTLLGYFNSLRVLGGAALQVEDDVKAHMKLLATRAGKDQRLLDAPIEMTSNEASSDIPEHLNRMGRSLGSEGIVDVVLATNMISVGVDVNRLGLMAVMGQPQSTSEYIQATSRVGRRYPGLVVVLFNSARSRDRSHYESFSSFHSALYRQVESTSVTPFAIRARDRGLHAVLVALTRMLVPELRGNNGAADIVPGSAQIQRIKDAIVNRVQAIDGDEAEATAKQIEDLLEQWFERAQEGGLVYTNFNDPSRALLTSAGNSTPEDETFETLWSLRDVDQESNLFLHRIRTGRD